MTNPDKDIFRNLAQEGVQIHDPKPLAAIAAEVQAHFRAMPDANMRVRTAKAFYSELDLSEFSLAERFQQTFAVDAASLPQDLGKLLVFYAMTRALPGHDPCPPSRELDHIIGGASAAVALALLQDDQTAEEGVEVLERITALLT